LRLKRIYRAIKFLQSSWFKEWIDLNTNFGKAAKNDFEKDHFKLLNNAVLGKCMENVRNRIEVKTAFDAKY
jgi:transglutaminase/protease-like cytokinesis protein 3